MKNPPRVSGHQRLIEATLRSIAEHGHRRTTVRTIAEIAGVTPGLVTHYFDGKDELLFEAYRHFKDRALAVHLSEADRAEPDPVGRLEAFVRSVLFFNGARAEQMRIWAGFVDLVITDSNAAAVQTATHDRFIREISNCVIRIHRLRGESLSADAASRVALGINSVIDGIWLERSLNPSRMTPEEALDTALDMIGARLGVSFRACLATTA